VFSVHPDQLWTDQAQDEQQAEGDEKITPAGQHHGRQLVGLGQVADKNGSCG
jgi:hypothetical protein